MYDNHMILSKLKADEYLALTLEHALAGVWDEIFKQAKRIESGATRAVFYTSCFTTYYQDVCARQKEEDIRMMMAIAQLVSHGSVIEKMVGIYVDLLLDNLTPDRIERIQRALIMRGANFASTSLTNRAFGSAITSAALYSFGLSVSIEKILRRYATRGVTVVGLYSYVQEAADAAARLRQQNGIYYDALYTQDLEMLYFLIEPVIGRSATFTQIFPSDDDIVEALIRILK